MCAPIEIDPTAVNDYLRADLETRKLIELSIYYGYRGIRKIMNGLSFAVWSGYKDSIKSEPLPGILALIAHRNN
jgi:hypothetical protein